MPNVPGTSLGTTLDGLRVLVAKRITAWTYLKNAGEGRVYWFNVRPLCLSPLAARLERMLILPVHTRADGPPHDGRPEELLLQRQDAQPVSCSPPPLPPGVAETRPDPLARAQHDTLRRPRHVALGPARRRPRARLPARPPVAHARVRGRARGPLRREERASAPTSPSRFTLRAPMYAREEALMSLEGRAHTATEEPVQGRVSVQARRRGGVGCERRGRLLDGFAARRWRGELPLHSQHRECSSSLLFPCSRSLVDALVSHRLTVAAAAPFSIPPALAALRARLLPSPDHHLRAPHRDLHQDIDLPRGGGSASSQSQSQSAAAGLFPSPPGSGSRGSAMSPAGPGAGADAGSAGLSQALADVVYKVDGRLKVRPALPCPSLSLLFHP